MVYLTEGWVAINSIKGLIRYRRISPGPYLPGPYLLWAQCLPLGAPAHTSGLLAIAADAMHTQAFTCCACGAV